MFCLTARIILWSCQFYFVAEWCSIQGRVVNFMNWSSSFFLKKNYPTLRCTLKRKLLFMCNECFILCSEARTLRCGDNDITRCVRHKFSLSWSCGSFGVTLHLGREYSESSPGPQQSARPSLTITGGATATLLI